MRQRCQYIAKLEEIGCSRFDTIPWMYVRWHRCFWRGREMEMSCLCNTKKSPWQIFTGVPCVVFQGTFAQAYFILVNASTNFPILQHFITASPLHGVICSYSNPVPSSSFAQYCHTVKHASTSHKAPSSKHRHCQLMDNALRSISIISMTTEPGTIVIEAFQKTKRSRRPSAFQILGQKCSSL
jgi:hypothetical protein